nr:immunoglobulin heavy chain junction region [Mus musculus]NSM04766.1 immunoglobulin heavy chain junction region [Mus musculus]NSM04963.1 immunoglobulin heavy chain junction region [Mus musculus]NSM05456.1 immunoglobulin heavy chain junction region [Mus musculus]NSM07382.1 immunoglobulin heavy chain junction region [Mus musculus]
CARDTTVYYFDYW